MIEHRLVIPNATTKNIYEALLSSEKHSSIIGDEAVVSDVVGDTFSTFSGYATGKNVELVPYSKLVQTWRASDWPEGHYSTIEFNLSDSDEGAVIHFTQTNMPEGTEDEFDAGWRDNYWSKLIDYFGSD